MNNACPECSAVYAVAEKDIGRRIACKKCNAALIVAEEGLKRDDSAAAPRKDDTAERERDRDKDRERGRDRDDDDRPRKRDRDRDDRDRDDDDRPSKKKDKDREDDEERPRERKARTGPGAGEIFNKLKGIADVPTWVYGAGLFLTIYSFFMPAIEASKISSREGAKTIAERDFAVYERSINGKPDGKTPTAEETKALEEKKKEFEKRTKLELDDDIKYAQAGAQRAQWWNVMFRMLGFCLLVFGSIAYMVPEQSMLKRILGGTTILLVLLQIIGGGASLNLALGGRGGPG